MRAVWLRFTTAGVEEHAQFHLHTMYAVTIHALYYTFKALQDTSEGHVMDTVPHAIYVWFQA
jgi:hypothetical protein